MSPLPVHEEDGWLQELHDKGWTFDGPVANDLGTLVPPDGDES
jgi:hypothetical protein